jgi:hypothetical protein
VNADTPKFSHILRLTLNELYRQIDELLDEIAELKGSGEGFDIEAPFDPWRVE